MPDAADERPRGVVDLSPEARERRARTLRGRLEREIREKAGPGTRVFIVAQRVWTGVYHDGFIHAGNFAYMALLSLFPFFIAAAAIVSIIGEQNQREASIDAILVALPPAVGSMIGPVARSVVAAREGWLLWAGGAIGLWTASSLIETIRDILHRSYGTTSTRAFWQYRLDSIGLTFAAVMLLLLSLGAQVAITAIQQFLYTYFPQLDMVFSGLLYTRVVSALALFAAVLVLFKSLTPTKYQGRQYPKWPGALFIAGWWVLLLVVLPIVLRTFFSYDLTYGSLAGVMIALFFFWLVGLGVVVGAALNAALAVAPEELALTGSDAENVTKTEAGTGE